MRIVLLGARAEPLPALTAAGHRVTVLHEPWEAGRAAALRDRVTACVQVDSYGSTEAMLAALARTGPAEADAVATIAEFAVVPAALLGAALGARALDPDVALRCRDKAVQKAAWRAAGVPTANWVLAPHTAAEPERAVALAVAQGLTGPLVVKPVSSAGTRGCAVAPDLRSLASVIRNLARDDDSLDDLVVEEYNRGDEWHFDGVVRRGRLEALLVSKYLAPVIETRDDRPIATATFPHRAHPGLQREAAELTLAALRALGLTDAAFHFEAFGGPGRFTAGELAARPGGSWIKHLARHALGIDLFGASVQTVTGDPTEFRATTDRSFGFTHLPTVPGRCNRLGPEDLLAIPGVLEVELGVPYGEPLPGMRESALAGAGRALVEAADREACEAVLRAVVARALEVSAGG
ncbi:ATP-grasp domain-containing protein [Streptomyces sp. 1331.2]|uniref:ATP-grasp domain-containing protein n=1 Tax=Streptomyces sp. 1331.2 TaxID=1938835 RepID=UPI000BDBBDD7|nr:hypothetical protein [Streptomyces sp. 1331.2]SOB86021.1 Biotin carboxylase [Streptomyces sp. 1331.2]